MWPAAQVATNVASIALTLATCVACSSLPPKDASATIVQENEIGYMSRHEVSAAIEDCESVNQRAVVVYTKANWKGRMVSVPVDVQCMPGYKQRKN